MNKQIKISPFVTPFIKEEPECKGRKDGIRAIGFPF
jgi:hypothetical protein